MLNNDEKLQAKIKGFMRRKEAQYPELAQQSNREHVGKDSYKSGHVTHWTLSLNS